MPAPDRPFGGTAVVSFRTGPAEAPLAARGPLNSETLRAILDRYFLMVDALLASVTLTEEEAEAELGRPKDEPPACLAERHDWTLPEALAVIDAIERFWQLRTTDTAAGLRAVGLVRDTARRPE